MATTIAVAFATSGEATNVVPKRCPAKGPGGGGRVHVAPAVSCMDQRVTMVVRRLRPGESVTLMLEALDYAGVQWRSAARFRADASGRVDTAFTPALGGSYQGIWQMGLVSSMQCVQELKKLKPGQQQPEGASPYCTPLYEFEWPAFSEFRLTATNAVGRVVGSEAFERVLGPPGPSFLCTLSSGAASSPLHTSTLYYLPSKDQKCQQWQTHQAPGILPAVLAIGGSGESVPYVLSQALAAHGFPAYALAYYGGPNLPKDFTKIPIEFFLKALLWLKDRVGYRPLVVYGFSRGSEAAQLLASYHRVNPYVRGLILASPSSVANGCHCPGKAAAPTWTVNMNGVPTPVPTNPRWNGPTAGNPPWWGEKVGSSRVDLQACKLEYSIVSPK